MPNENGTLARIDPSTNAVVARVRVGADPDNVVACRGRIWTSSLRGPKLVAVDPRTNRVSARVTVGTGTVGFACAASLWTATYSTGFLLRIDPRTLKVTARLRVGDQPRSIVIAAGSIWVANQSSGTVSRVSG